MTNDNIISFYRVGNPLKCEFIWENVWDQLGCQRHPLECRDIFLDQDTTTCQFYRQKIVPSGIFYYNLTQIFDSKIVSYYASAGKTCVYGLGL